LGERVGQESGNHFENKKGEDEFGGTQPEKTLNTIMPHMNNKGLGKRLR